jgi:hypothetical protein
MLILLKPGKWVVIAVDWRVVNTGNNHLQQYISYRWAGQPQ